MWALNPAYLTKNVNPARKAAENWTRCTHTCGNLSEKPCVSAWHKSCATQDMKTDLQNAITGQYVVTSMSMDWDAEQPAEGPSIFTTMSIEYTHDPLPSATIGSDSDTAAL
jgi:hypothetical protein